MTFFIFFIFEYADSNTSTPLFISFSPGKTLVWYILKTSSAMSWLMYFLGFGTLAICADVKFQFACGYFWLLCRWCEASKIFVKVSGKRFLVTKCRIVQLSISPTSVPWVRIQTPLECKRTSLLWVYKNFQTPYFCVWNGFVCQLFFKNTYSYHLSFTFQYQSSFRGWNGTNVHIELPTCLNCLVGFWNI